ncbi:nose resistant to fluoxetine protein 6-like [Drosophila innubila]|uniref:nose resistant to fluoxetine protein 6-like n=1 Tax=Drosophila innubila TaxID=198719 RepID=UPI00148D2C08|nr:nose resistant to fluoxetine protein 6-like [Drosophila innubila]XP_034490265.1 nose resistant to fluoxetine protein 6-like [Drosophila innubila]XP_034490266.1 nose resistant to fluoxetine protein 6-like [Drosophila innubila]
MVKSIVILLHFLCGLMLISALNLEMQMEVPQADQLEAREYLELRKLQSLGLEFSKEFQGIGLSDLEIPNGRAPSAQDLQCLTDMGLWMQGIASGSFWSLKMIDAWGSKPAGILSLNVIDLGNYEQCIKINKLISSNHEVKGKYCLTNIPFGKMLGINSTVIRSVNLKIGVCFPASCSETNMDTFLNRVINQLINVNYSGKLINENTCNTSEHEPLTGLTIFTVVLLSVFGALALLATLYDYFICQDQTQLPALIKIFSVRATSRALFRLTNPRSNPNVIDCLHGMRCMSLFWVVFGHEYMFGLVSPNINQLGLLYWLESPFQNMIIHGVFSVDTFFFLSGLLVIMIALRSMERSRGKLNIPLMYLHRYLRLAPLLAVAILVYMKLMPLVVDGPLGNGTFEANKQCENTWFWTLLFVQNYATMDICLGHTWYLGVDMQLYIISPILLIALYKWGKKAAIGIVVLIVLLSVWLFTIMMVKEYSMFFRNGINSEDSQRWLYFSTHLHATPWLIGAVFGYILHVNRGKCFKLSRPVVWTGWFVCLATVFACLFALVPYDKFNGPKLTLLGDATYYTLTRLAWPLALCWIVFACMEGYGGMANSFLSSPLWQPLSKLSYAVYVWHILIQEVNVRRTQTSTYFSDYEMMLKFWSDFGFTVLVAYATYITIEAPLGGLESLLLSTRKSTPNPSPAAKEVREIVTEKSSVLDVNSTDVEAAPTIPTITTPTLSA